MPRPTPAKQREKQERDEMLGKLTESDAIRILLHSYTVRPMGPRGLGKVRCQGAGGRRDHWILPSEARASYRGLYLCWECSRAAGYEQIEEQAQAELGQVGGGAG